VVEEEKNMSLLPTIDADYQKAFRGGDKAVTGVLRVLKTALYNAEIEKRTTKKDREAKLTDEEAQAVVRRQIKQLEEAGELFKKGGREDLVAKNEAELAILKKYVPAQASEEEVRAAVKKVLEGIGKVGPSDFGKIMGAAMKELQGGADGTVVSKVVKEMLIPLEAGRQ
jgi:hypothetical protein